MTPFFVHCRLVETVVAFLLYMFVLDQWAASGTSYVFVFVPLVTIVVAATVAGEAITTAVLAGTALHDHSGEVLHRCA